MKFNFGNGGEGGGAGGCRFALPESIMANRRGENGRMLETRKLMRIIQEENEVERDSSSSSSIGDNSDDNGSDDDREGDAQSRCRYECNGNNGNSGSFDDAIQALEESLPIRRGISTFYNGKSKSFTSLADVWSSSTPSIKDIAKPENAYSRKRRNLLASTLSDKNRALLLSNTTTGRISKKPKTTTSRFLSENGDLNIKDHVNRSSSSSKQNLSSLRSFSMVNLHQCSTAFAFNSPEVGNAR